MRLGEEGNFAVGGGEDPRAVFLRRRRRPKRRQTEWTRRQPDLINRPIIVFVRPLVFSVNGSSGDDVIVAVAVALLLSPRRHGCCCCFGVVVAVVRTPLQLLHRP